MHHNACSGQHNRSFAPYVVSALVGVLLYVLPIAALAVCIKLGWYVA